MVAGFSLFDTAIGRCGIAWSEQGVSALRLPATRDAVTRAALRERFPDRSEGVPPPAVQEAIDAIVALLRGEESNLDAIVLDFAGVPPFHRRVYDVTRAIPRGSTLSYGEVATRLGTPGGSRAVGQALGRNPLAIVIPCHRVLAAKGKVGGFTAEGGVRTKLAILAIEKAATVTAPSLFEGDGTFPFDPEVAIRALRLADPALANLIDRVGPFRMRLAATPSVFRALAEAIVYQQLTGKAAATIFARVQALFPAATESPTPAQILRVAEEKLRAAGLSRAKTLALRDLATKAKNHEIPLLAEIHALTNEEIIERLTAVRGVGRWTVEMFLMFRLGRPDVLPVGDYGIRKGFAVAFKKRALPTPQALEKRGLRWKPFRTVASWYLWRATELSKEGS